MYNVKEKLRKTSKGKLVYHREKSIEDIYEEIEKLIYLSIAPSKYQNVENEIYDDLMPFPESLQKKINSGEFNDSHQTIPDSELITKYAKMEQFIIQYETERKSDVKKRIVNLKSNWDKCIKNTFEESKRKYQIKNMKKKIENEKEKQENLEQMKLQLEIIHNEIKIIIEEMLQRLQLYPQLQTSHVEDSLHHLKEIYIKIGNLMIVCNRDTFSTNLEEALFHLRRCKETLSDLDNEIGKLKDFKSQSDISKQNNIITPLLLIDESSCIMQDISKSVTGSTDSSKESFSNTITQTSVLPPQTSSLFTTVANTSQSNSQMNISSISTSKMELKLIDQLSEINRSNKMDELEEMDSNIIFNENQNKQDEILLNQFVSKEAFERYVEVLEFCQKWEKSYQLLMIDPQWKKIKFDLQKAINTPINSTSDISITHLCDKIKRLEAFLSGKTVEITGKNISINICSEGPHFCKDLLAKKLVGQGESQVSSRPEAAFPLATLTVYLCQQYPEIMKLFLAHVYKKCPYLIPYYIPQQEGQTEEENYKALGYLYINGVIEKQVMFLKRMSGIVRLYAAIIQTPPIIDKPHPHGIEHGWIWFANLMNLEPRLDITATILVDFLEVAGHTMQKTYGKQFQKLLEILALEFLPKIKEVTPIGSGGPLQRLENFLEGISNQKIIPPSSAMLNSQLWKSS